MSIGYSGGGLSANNEIVQYLPNTLSFDKGTPEKNVRPQVVGDGRVVNVTTSNFETAKSMLKFDMISNSNNIAQLDSWVANDGENVLTYTPEDDGDPIVFRGMTVINKPEITISQDGQFSVELEGNPAQ